MSDTGNHPILGMEHVGALAGYVHNEFRAVLMDLIPPMDAETGIKPGSILDQLSEAGAFTVAKPVSQDLLYSALRTGIQRGILEKRGYGRYRQTPVGDIVAGFAGHALTIGVGTNVPMQALIGKDSVWIVDGEPVRNGVGTRAVLLAALVGRPRGRWMSHARLAEYAAEHGIARNAAWFGEESLKTAGVIEKRHRRAPGANHHISEVRLRKVEGTEYREAVEAYLPVLACLATVDLPKLREGREKLRSAVLRAKEKGYLSLLLKRAQVNSDRPL
jgi:hypothetical protein